MIFMLLTNCNNLSLQLSRQQQQQQQQQREHVSVHHETAFGSLLASSLGSLTLASLGFGRSLAASDATRLPKVPTDGNNKLVLLGSGNVSPSAPASVSAPPTSFPPTPTYEPIAITVTEFQVLYRFMKMGKAAF
jgi:hypothetical protein